MELAFQQPTQKGGDLVADLLNGEVIRVEVKMRVGAPPEKGKANERVRELLAEHFKIPKSRIFLVSGATFREKVFSIEF